MWGNTKCTNFAYQYFCPAGNHTGSRKVINYLGMTSSYIDDIVILRCQQGGWQFHILSIAILLSLKLVNLQNLCAPGSFSAVHFVNGLEIGTCTCSQCNNIVTQKGRISHITRAWMVLSVQSRAIGFVCTSGNVLLAIRRFGTYKNACCQKVIIYFMIWRCCTDTCYYTHIRPHQKINWRSSPPVPETSPTLISFHFLF